MRMVHEKIQSEVRKAKTLYACHGNAMALDPVILALTDGYRRAIEKTGTSMSSMGVPAACTACVEKGSGSCCFQGIEEGYDHVLLLANLLLGCDLPDSAEDPASCFFVGSKGCKLTARYYFCLHYFCPDLMQVLGKDRVQALLITLGEELSIGWQLEQAVRNRLAAIPQLL
jgi:hypothetical protein